MVRSCSCSSSSSSSSNSLLKFACPLTCPTVKNYPRSDRVTWGSQPLGKQKHSKKYRLYEMSVVALPC